MKKVDLEILVSTMNRTDLSFLEPMFLGREWSKFHILIINQTTPVNSLESDRENVRVVNSFEYGLSKSRNLALENSIGRVVLIADDDMIYKPDFDEKIIEAFEKYPEAALIRFQLLGRENRPFNKYEGSGSRISSVKEVPSLSSCELALKPAVLDKNNIRFDEHFGLGANFPSGEEIILLQEILNRKLPVGYVPETIGKHPGESTGSRMESEDHIRGIAALKHLKYGSKARLSLLRYVCLLVKNKKILLQKMNWAYQVGREAIEECKLIYENRNNPFQ